MQDSQLNLLDLPFALSLRPGTGLAFGRNRGFDLRDGAPLAWLIDPVDVTVTIYRPGQPTPSSDRPDLVMADPPVQGCELRTTRLYP